MESFWVSLIFTLLVTALLSSQTSSSVPNLYGQYRRNHDGISEFRLINRRSLVECSGSYPYLSIQTNPNSSLPNDVNVTVTVSGVPDPSESDWVAMITPSNLSVSTYSGLQVGYYFQQTGDFSNLPLLCHYAVKGQFLTNDPSYLSCKNSECHQKSGNECTDRTCSGSITFHVIFVCFSGGFGAPCQASILLMRLTWVSGDDRPQEVKYGSELKSVRSNVSTFTRDDMCNPVVVPIIHYIIFDSPAWDYGWHDPGYIHSAIMTGLEPYHKYSYRYGSDSVGWSDTMTFDTPPAAGSDTLSFLVYGDMGKAPLDPSTEHYIQPGSVSVAKAIERELENRKVDSIFHIGDISYATGFLVEWEYFLQLVQPIASRIPYMTAIGNHERDYFCSGSFYSSTDSGGECGVPYASHFQMPMCTKDRPWYSIKQGPAHFTIVSTEHEFGTSSTQFEWIKQDLPSVNRTRTPWLIFAGHRPMYSSNDGTSQIPLWLRLLPFITRNIGLSTVDMRFRDSIEPLLLSYKVDLALFGHIHNYERTCAVYQEECISMPIKGKDGVDTYQNNNYTAPVHVMAGMAGFELDGFPNVKNFSLMWLSEYGFGRVDVTKNELLFQFINSTTMEVRDSFRIMKKLS
ncbi:hypothetical protein LUZ60_004253 [Juncus effusus]|nr:hypothetical protein LUZ60_004253 [Juncus effusus]